MPDDDEIQDGFRTDHFWNQSTVFTDSSDQQSLLFAPIRLDETSIEFDHPYATRYDLEHELRLPALETFEFELLPEQEDLNESITTIDVPTSEPREDVWEAVQALDPLQDNVAFYTWEAFEKTQSANDSSPYFTECGLGVFNAALAVDDAKIGSGQVVTSDILLQSLWNLGLGRESLLFTFNAKSKTFESAIPDGRPSGTSLRASQSLVSEFLHTGNVFLRLRSFAERTLASMESIPAKVALATCVTSILSTLENQLGRHSTKITSFIQLQRQFSGPREILLHLSHLVDATKHAMSNDQLASIVYHRFLEFEDGEASLRQLWSQILSRVAAPSLEMLSEWIGVRHDEHFLPIWERDSFIAIDELVDESAPLEYIYRSEMMPRFISPEDGNIAFETGNSLRFLKTQHPNHPLARMSASEMPPAELNWAFEWAEIEATAARSKDYEDFLRRTMLQHGEASKSGDEPAVLRTSNHVPIQFSVEQSFESDFESSIRLFDAAPDQFYHALPDGIQNSLKNIHDKVDQNKRTTLNSFSPPLSLISVLSFRPLLTAQAKLVNAATLRLFFRSHHLRLHLALQRQYHLFGDGVFSSLLTASLFDPERESAERHKGKMRTGVQMGLQLGSRSSWPPASSELRLALRGVLSESYYASALYRSSFNPEGKISIKPPLHGRETDELPGQLNFAIRHLAEAEQEKVMNPDALPALDFLRLQYVPPPPLNLVITSASLDKYDTIFKFLLRLLRMLFVVSHLPRYYTSSASRKMRMEAHHFVTVFVSYVFQTGIAEHWNEFELYVSTIENRLLEEDLSGDLGTRVTEGIASLRDIHDQCLDSILFSLLLRRRQRKIVALVDEIFDYILLFAKMQNPGVKAEESVSSLYAKLRGKVRVLISVCRGLTGKNGYGKGKGTTEMDTMERLVAAMEMNAYFGGT